MDCPFIRNPIDVEAVIIRNALRRERIFRPRLDILSFPEEYLFEQHIGKATVCRAVRKVSLALKCLLPVMVVFPGHKPVRNIKEEFHRIAGLPNVLGCVDGTQIPITAPAENEADYVNRKSFHSINVQICDAAYIVTNVEAKWPGSVHDSRIYRECRLSNRFARGEFDGYLPGDRGYPCQPSLLTPYPDPELGPQQRFNVARCRTRARVEMTLGILKSRFQCLQKLRVTPERACDIIVACAALLRGELQLRPERVIRPCIDVLAFPEHFLFERYRFTSQSIIYIHNLIRPYISNITNRSRALTSQQIVCVALRFFANGSFLYNVGDAEHLSKATVCRVVRKVCLALKRLLPMFIVFPGHKPVRAIKEEFHRIAGFPSVIGCIDGTHIPITAPSHNEADYVNRKSIHSINVQIICDAAHIISNVEAKWPGSVHDARIYRESNLSNRLQRGEFDGLLLGDRGYPCQPRLLTPYPEPGPQQNFNRAHCRTRARVEMTIGLLKARFQCLRHLRVTPDRACDIIVACVVLHNIATIRGEQHPALQIDDADDDPIHLPAIQDGRTNVSMLKRHSIEC
ncbi:putative nuclease HARBI1 [Merluccius polli]|uniref:Putative nuclease HARBI1 n=1 Tax=Merluccius polli TaxID=89951 RepID=A0AA47NSY1_MERPO|nr:putative nuclease HARBI1 [Merluccius polli]